MKFDINYTQKAQFTSSQSEYTVGQLNIQK